MYCVTAELTSLTNTTAFNNANDEQPNKRRLAKALIQLITIVWGSCAFLRSFGVWRTANTWGKAPSLVLLQRNHGTQTSLSPSKVNNFYGVSINR